MLGSETLNALNAIFSNDQIDASENTLINYGLALNGSVCTPMVVVFPTSELQLQQLVLAANKHHWQLHTLARGKNWGYGTAQGTLKNQIIVDLSRFNEVVELNEEQAYVRVRPGISQIQLYNHLQNFHSRLQLDITAAGENTSVVGNILERGFGHTDYSDRFGSVLALRVLLPNGDIVTTGMNAFANSKAKHVYNYGIGPVTSGLFSQSNFGIVLEMTIALQPKPEFFATLIIMTKDENAAADMVTTIGQLKMDGVITSGVHTASMSRAVGNESVKMAGKWVATASVSGPKAIAMARFKHIKKTIKKQVAQSSVILMTDKRWAMMQRINKFAKSKMIDGLEVVINLKKGIPNDLPMKTLLEDPKAHSGMSTAEFPAYFRWICAVSPCDKYAIREMLELCKGLFEKYGYEQRYTMTNITERAVVLISNIRFGKTEADIEKARAFYHEMDALLIGSGYCPYRSGSGLFDAAREHVDAQNLAMLNAIKQTLDPNNILSPGKYWIGEEAAKSKLAVA